MKDTDSFVLKTLFVVITTIVLFIILFLALNISKEKSDIKYLDAYCKKFHTGTQPQIHKRALYFCVRESETGIETFNVKTIEFETWKALQKERNKIGR